MPLPRRSVLGAALAAPALLGQARAQATPLPFGALYPFSGSLAQLGDESYRGLELAADERNAAGGVLGQPIKLVKGDAADPNQAIAEARRLTGPEKAGALFGTTASPLCFAASQVTELAGIPYFELGAIGDVITDRGFKNLYRSCPMASLFALESVNAVASALAPLWGVDAKSLNLAILHEDGLYGTAVSGFQADRCKALGLKVIDNLSYSLNTVDFGSIVQRLRGASTDVVLHAGYQNDIVLFFRQMKQVGWKPRMIVGTGGGYSLTDTAAAIGPDFTGTVNVDFTPYQVNPQAAPGVREIETAYEKKYGAKPRSGHSLANYMGGNLFFEIVQRAGSLDKDKVRAAVLATDVAVGATATGWGAKFDDKGQNTRAKPFLLQWQSGAEITILPEDAAVGQLRPTLG